METRNSQTAKASLIANAAEIADFCINHLANEIDLLEQLLQLSQNIHEHVGLRQTDTQLSEPLVKATSERSKKLSEDRLRLRDQISSALDLPIQQATIKNLIPFLPDEQSKTVEEQRARLLNLEESVQRQNNTNSLIISQTMDLYQKIACELSGTGSPSTYSPQGEMAQQNSPNLIQTDC